MIPLPQILAFAGVTAYVFGGVVFFATDEGVTDIGLTMPDVVHRDAPDPVTALSPRERELLPHLVEGLSNQEIAVVMGCTVHNVKHLVESVFRKFGTSNRVKAAVHAVREGLV